MAGGGDTYSSFNLLNSEENIIEFVSDMVDENGVLADYPPYHDNLTSVRLKRKCIERHLEERLNAYDRECAKEGAVSSLCPKANGQQMQLQTQLQRFKIVNPLLTSITCKFLEVKARVGANQMGQYKYAIVPNKISSIDFLGHLHEVIQDKLLNNLVEDLRNYHQQDVDEGGSVAMFVNRHQVSCKLPCGDIMSKKENSVFKQECLSQRITLGSYYFPFIVNYNDKLFKHEGNGADYPGIFGDLMIYKNAYIWGIGSKTISTDRETFVECQEPVNAIMSFRFSEVGVFNRKVILYLQSVHRVYYSTCELIEMKSAKSILLDLLRHDTVFRNIVKVNCYNKGKPLPVETELDFSDTESVEKFLQRQRLKTGGSFKRKASPERREEHNEDDDAEGRYDHKDAQQWTDTEDAQQWTRDYDQSEAQSKYRRVLS